MRDVLCLAFLTFLTFFGLKLAGAIGWSWWLVTSPLTGAVGLLALIWIALFVGMFPGEIRAEKKRRQLKAELEERLRNIQ